MTLKNCFKKDYTWVLFFLFLCLSVVSSGGCKEKKLLTTASFTETGEFVTPAKILFTNTSLNADTFYWEFGDGSYSSNANPVKMYENYGLFTVTLTASNTSTGAKAVMTKNINIRPGTVYITSITLTEVSHSNLSGQPWDNNSEPDIYPTLQDSAGVLTSFVREYIDDAPNDTLPRKWELNPMVKVEDRDKAYFIGALDYDPIGDDDLIGVTEGFRINLVIKWWGFTEAIKLKDEKRGVTAEVGLYWK